MVALADGGVGGGVGGRRRRRGSGISAMENAKRERVFRMQGKRGRIEFACGGSENLERNVRGRAKFRNAKWRE